MNLLVLMYHRAQAEQHGNPPELLDAHFAHIANSFRNVVPGDDLSSKTLNVCLSFDDGYFDFYAIVFPLLKKHQLRAVLAIPPFHITDETRADPNARLSVNSDDAFANPGKGGFCTWHELGEMAVSGHVTIASHGFTHVRLDQFEVHLPTEIEAPKNILSKRLAQPIESFVFPFGRYTAQSLRRAKEHYRYVFRIGGAINRGWSSRVLYRVNADSMTRPDALFTPGRMIGYRARYCWNRLRLR